MMKRRRQNQNLRLKSVLLMAGLTLIMSSPLMIGCSQRWVEADSGLSGDQVLQRVDDVREANSLSSNGS
ncbi:MAG: hypothetical protein HRT45_07575, partial [Bdellovibrionales bacterium]|nr:hypothetical protein [Bdellovibrionales bacterium]